MIVSEEEFLAALTGHDSDLKMALEALRATGQPFCLIGGLAVNLQFDAGELCFVLRSARSREALPASNLRWRPAWYGVVWLACQVHPPIDQKQR